MKALLILLLALTATVGFSQAQTCNNPFVRLFAGFDWDFPYLSEAVVQTFDSQVCPGYDGRNSCCDATVYNALANAWLKLYAETVAVKADLDFLKTLEGTIQQGIANLNNAIQNDNALTQDQKNALTTFFNAIGTATVNLINSVETNFPPCYSAVLRFYAGMLCKVCDPNWTTWITLFNVTANPAIAAWELHFAESTCTAFGNDCGPFFASFWTYELAVLQATEQLLSTIPGFNVTQFQAALPTSINVPCSNASQCLEYICFEFLAGIFVRLDYGATNGRRRSSPILSEFFVIKDQSSALVPRNTGLSSTSYDGSFDPTSSQTGLKTNAGSSSSPASTLSAFWTFLLA